MNIEKIVVCIISLGTISFSLTFFVSANLIGNDVKNQCKIVQEEYKEDCVGALMKLIEDEATGYGEKNSAVWAFGQIGDKRALPFLKKYYTGNKKDRTKWNEELSQYELYKAIKLLNDGFNVTAFIWR